MQARLEAAEVSGTAGGGMVTVTLNGKGVMRQIKIDPKLVDAGEVEMLEDLILAAVNDARAQVDSHVKEEMAKVHRRPAIARGHEAALLNPGAVTQAV